MELDPHDALEVPKGASPEQIRQAFRRLLRLWHPDINTAPNASQKVDELARAYQALRSQAQALTQAHSPSTDLIGTINQIFRDALARQRYSPESSS